MSDAAPAPQRANRLPEGDEDMEHLEDHPQTRPVERPSPPERAPAALAALCRAAVEDVRARFADCTIEYVPDPDRDGTGVWDARRIQYAATVLLEDAVKRCEGTGPVSLRWREYEDEVVLRVQYPRPLEQGDRFVTLFEDRIEPDGADDRVGTLRLVVARKILLQHGGQLARVRTHSGTCYVATWPRLP
jgi:signal transduction histidine kinase